MIKYFKYNFIDKSLKIFDDENALCGVYFGQKALEILNYIENDRKTIT